VAGNAHVDRFKKASELKEEAHRRLYGIGGGSTGAPGNSKKRGAQLRGAYSVGSAHGYGSGSGDGTAEGEGEGEEEVGGGDQDLPPSYDAHAYEAGPAPGYSEVHNPPPHSGNKNRSSSSGRGGAGGGGGGYGHSSSSADDDYAIVELLERERREWHLERVKLLQCVHLQQLELAARASAAQETAAAIAKEFAASIEAYELRLLALEGGMKAELVEIKELLKRR